MNTTMSFHILTSSPIHIGCDEVYEPMSFVIDEQRDLLVSFDPFDFLKGLNDGDRQRFSDICKKGSIESILEIYKFMRGKRCPGHEVRICTGFKKHYQETLAIPLRDDRKIQQELNKFVISRTAFNPLTNLPYIPGSSIKGALRTAWLNRKQQDKKVPKVQDARKAKDLEKELMDGGSFDTDPFRLVKVSDFMPVGRARTRISYAVNEKKRMSEYPARGPFQILEVIEPGSMFEGSITVNVPPDGSKIVSPVDIRSLLNSAIRFYVSEKKREDDELSKIGCTSVNMNIPEGGFIFRIGRHSGAESLTIEGHRSIRIMKGRGQQAGSLDHATTLWLSSPVSKSADNASLAPFGWVTAAQGPAPRELKEESEHEGTITEDTRAVGACKPPEHKPEKAPAQQILDELAMIKPEDMGRIGTVIQKTEQLPDDSDRASIAAAIRDKIGPKAFKKHKRRDLLESWLKGA